MKNKGWIRRFVAGLGMGIAAAIPGVSASAIAVITKVFESLVEALSGFRKHIKNSVFVLLPILIGAVIAAIPTVIVMEKAVHSLLFAIVTLFAGFIIGSLPGITDEIKKEETKKKDIIILIICAIVALTIGILSWFLGDKLNISEHVKAPEWYMFLLVIPVGIIASAGLIVPGISGSMLLLIMGFYTPFVTYLKEFIKNFFTGKFSSLNWRYIGLLVCFAIGVIIGCVLFSKLMHFLLGKNRNSTYVGILGFVLGSVVSLYVNHDIRQYYVTWGAVKWYYELIIAIVFLIVGFIIAHYLVKAERKHKQETVL